MRDTCPVRQTKMHTSRSLLIDANRSSQKNDSPYQGIILSLCVVIISYIVNYQVVQLCPLKICWIDLMYFKEITQVECFPRMSCYGAWGFFSFLINYVSKHTAHVPVRICDCVALERYH